MKIVKCPACHGKKPTNMQIMSGTGTCGFCFGVGELSRDEPEPIPESKPKKKYTKKSDLVKGGENE